jgi:predicted nucleotidyltransferase
MTSLNSNHQETIIQLICARVADPVAIYLFGSVAADAAHESSDIDIAVLPQEPLSTETRWNLQQELAIALRTDVDLVDLLSASTVMRLQVVSNGELLFEGDLYKRAEFEMITFSMYARLNEERKEILEQVRREGRVYG